MIRSLTRLLPSPRTARGKVGIVAFLSAFLVLASTTAGYAYWQSSLTATGTVSSANLTVSTANLTGATFGNESLTSTGSITATNTTTTTSTKTGLVTLTITGAGGGSLKTVVSRQVWVTSNAAGCATAAVPTGTTSSYWSTSVQVTATLAPQASASWCVRSTIASRDSVLTASGTDSFTTTVAGTIALQNFTGSASATATQQTRYMYSAYIMTDTTHWQWIRPNFSSASYNYCLDVSGGATDSGTIVISYGCKTAGASNQNWKFTRVSPTSNYFTIQPRNSTNLRIDNGSSTASGAGASVVTANSATNQQWSLQQVSPDVFQFVNALSGLCLTSPSGADQNLGQITQTACAGGQLQQFVISQAFENFTCRVSGGNFTWGWTTATTGAYSVQLTNGTVLASTTGTSASGISVATSRLQSTSTYNLTFVDANDTVVGIGSISRSNSGAYSCTAGDLQ